MVPSLMRGAYTDGFRSTKFILTQPAPENIPQFRALIDFAVTFITDSTCPFGYLTPDPELSKA